MLTFSNKVRFVPCLFDKKFGGEYISISPAFERRGLVELVSFASVKISNDLMETVFDDEILGD